MTGDDHAPDATRYGPQGGTRDRPTTHVLRSAAFASLYLAASYLGRLTVMDHTNLSLVWPAAGVAAVWFVTQRHSRLRALDVALLSGVTLGVNVATGASPALAGFFVAANVVQAVVFAWLFGRWLPELWGGGGTEAISRLQHLWRLLAIAAISTACGTVIGPTGVWVVNGTYSLPGAAVWLTRNTASMLLIGVAGLRIGYLIHHFWANNTGKRRAALQQAWRNAGRWHWAEYAAVLLASTATYLVAFAVNHGLPLAFPLLVVTVWAALRLHTTFVIAHDLLFGTLAVVFTLHGDGPFATIGSHLARALVVQLFVGVIAVVGLAVALGRDERARLMTDLKAARQEAAEQAEILRTIVDSMGEGLGVMDADGRFLLRNPAAGHLIGVTSTTGRFEDSAFYGLYRTDGTLVPDGEFPYQRALATGEPHSMDIVVRNPGVPQGRTLAVTATPMPNPINGVSYAVSTFSDVTAERRQRDELASFAGVVAHDLHNPLTTVEGWSEELADVPGAAAGIARIRRAATRMRNLINDLLSYTTARDGQLELATVDLAGLIADIAAARVDQAESTGSPVPRIAVGNLPHVYADVTLMRQLFENVLGNAIKYTAPGITPQIMVYTTSNDHDDIHIRVADNGIGIPTGQHDAVFNNFHRAHRTSDYAGTGLGLAICKRITERHGGTITATDNPDRPGTVIAISIPLAPQPARALITT
ncbi:ATP-binding protein [Actinoplanes xinjiangensis]|uniref:ATP-binding protein n=1 Tax=Actinoplanes xinjiangensis TaxID=512350 RepID=UPI0034174314